MLCWLGGVDAGSCWGAACCASRDVAARAVSACGRHPRAHAQLRGTGGRWRRPARPPRGPSWRRGALSATPPTRAAPPGFLHGSGGTGRCLRCSTRVGLASCTLTCHSRHMLCPPWPRHIHVMRGAALATMADPGRDAAAAVGARALLIALACPWRQLPTAGPRLRRPLGGAHGAGACDLLHGRACRSL